MAALAAAAGALTSVIEALPPPDQPDFQPGPPRRWLTCASLSPWHQRRPALAPATTELLRALATTRRQYDDLMLCGPEARSHSRSSGSMRYDA